MMREIKFRAWDDNEFHYNVVPLFGNEHEGPCIIEVHPLAGFRLKPVKDVQEYTGLHDKNGLTEIYEGDILDENGLIRGNIYESPSLFREGIDCIVAEMGTSAWRSTESIAMGLGCKYSK